MPNDVQLTREPPEVWAAVMLADPVLDRHGSFAVLAGDEPVALAWLDVDHGRRLAGNRMTGTLREHRHRGLARLAKLASIRWAAEHGIEAIGTGNDSTNRDMLALNEHLGYCPLPDCLVYTKETAQRTGRLAFPSRAGAFAASGHIYHVAVRSLYADLGGPVHYVDFGGSGPPLVLVHGLAGSALNWMAVGHELAARHRALAPDLRGFGRTPLGPGSRLRDNQALLDRFLREVAGTPATVVASSMGALLAVRQAADHPGTVAQLVLVDPALPWRAGRPFDPPLWALSAALVTPVVGGPVVGRRARRWGAERVVAAAFELCCSDPSRISPEVVRAHVALEAERIADPRSSRALVQAARSLAWALGRSEIETYHRIQVPTLVVHGDRDRLVPAAFSRAIGSRFAWQLVVLPGIGHLPMLECPAEFLEVTWRWLQARRGPIAADG